MTIKDVIEHLKTMPQELPQGRVDWIHQDTRTDSGTHWIESFTGQGWERVGD